MNTRFPAVLAALAIVPFAAACGDDEDTENANEGGKTPVADTNSATPQALAAAADKTTSQGSVRMSLDQKMSIAGQSIPSTAEGVFDPKTQKGAMTLKLDLSAMPGVGAAMGQGGKLDQKMVFDKFTIYMNSPMLKTLMPGGKEWIKFDLQKAGESLGFDINALSQGAGQDPTQVLQYLRGASGDIRQVGTEDVRGTPTKHYRATIQLRKVADAAPAAQRDTIRKSIEQLIKLGSAETVPVQVWVADDGTVRRMQQNITSNVGGQETKIDQTMELYDFGTKASIDIPADSETQDILELAKGGGAFGQMLKGLSGQAG